MLFQNNIEHADILKIKGFLNGNLVTITNQQLPVDLEGDYGLVIVKVDL